MKIVIYSEHWNSFWSIPDHFVDFLRNEFPELEFLRARNDTQLEEFLKDGEVFFGGSLTKKLVESAKNLKWIHVQAANVFPFLELGLNERNIMVTNSRGMHATPIAEHVLGFMIAFSRKFLESWRFQQNHHYGALEILSDPPLPGVLRGKTVLILGAGGIGKEVARLCKAFGMNVLATKKHIDQKVENVDRVFASQDFRDALPDADYVVICVPRTSETDGMIGAKEIALLKPNCVLINIARAKIVDHDALVDALKRNKIRGAALDVFEQEPLPSDSILYSLPNLMMTPHTAGVSSPEHWPRMVELFRENLQRYLANQPLLNVVNLRDGY